jgi:hypothetical protein
MVVLAPAALIDAPIWWTPIDDRRVRGSFTHGTQTVSAELVFSADHDLLDFISDHRLRASTDGRSFTRQRWSTPIGAYGQVRGRWVAVAGVGRWHAPPPEGRFDYVEFHVDDVAYNAANPASGVARAYQHDVLRRPRRLAGPRPSGARVW